MDGYHLMVFFGFDVGFGSDDYSATACFVGVFDSLVTVDCASGREVGGGDVFHEVRHFELRIFEQCDASVDCFGQIMGWHVCRHTHRDA